jgi:hypothetical protein
MKSLGQKKVIKPPKSSEKEGQKSPYMSACGREDDCDREDD